MSKPLFRKAFRIRADMGLRGSAAAYRFRESLFLLPVVLVIGGIVLALVTGTVDNALGAETRVPFTMAMDIDMLLGSPEKTHGLHPDDLARLHAIGADTTDPADHSHRRLTP